MSIVANLNEVEARISFACERAARARETVRLIAVSKTKPIEMVREAFASGQRAFGENYVQEAVEKFEKLPGAEWHFIGSLQTNKVKHLVGRVVLIHSVDRERLADEISKSAVNVGIVQDILLQIHVGDEATKHGVSQDEASFLVDHILGLPGVRLRGLMALPPLAETESEGRRNFALLRRMFERFRDEKLGARKIEFDQLSMGTSSDFEWAILEGATMVRVGTQIFGERG
jgi:pyridoxal phosphate enzyme (YggS family)